MNFDELKKLIETTARVAGIEPMADTIAACVPAGLIDNVAVACYDLIAGVVMVEKGEDAQEWR